MIFFFVSVYFSRFLLLRNLTGVFLLRRSDYKNIGKEGESEQFFRFNQSGQDTYYLSAYRRGEGDGSVNTFRRVSPGEEGYVKILSFIPWRIRGIYETREAQVVHLNENWKLEERKGGEGSRLSRTRTGRD